MSNNLNPVWNEDYRIEVCHFAEHLVFEVRDKDHAKSEFIGSVSIPTSMLLSEEVMENEYPIKKKNGHHRGKLELKIQVLILINAFKKHLINCCCCDSTFRPLPWRGLTRWTVTSRCVATATCRFTRTRTAPSTWRRWRGWRSRAARSTSQSPAGRTCTRRSSRRSTSSASRDGRCGQNLSYSGGKMREKMEGHLERSWLTRPTMEFR